MPNPTSDTFVQTMVMATRYVQVAILDDDASVRKALVRLFETSRYQVKAYASAGDFLATLDQNMPECIVADLQMPNMTGLELLSYLKRGRIDIPTIIITAFDEPTTRAQCISAGASAYLLKPVRKTALIAAIDDAIKP
ncbi:MAG TPA: response regulator [Pseudolabrys sp.]|nr:response regulator [Pseudolabrys sp.]